MQKLQKISDHFLYLPPYQETDRPILAAVKGSQRTLLIDAGNSENHAKLFLKQLEERQIKGDYLALTHWHWDHVFGMSEMIVPKICYSETKEKIKEMQLLSWEDEYLDERVKDGIEIPFCADAIKKELGNNRVIHLPVPEITFDCQLTIDLGGVTSFIEHIGGDHSSDSSIVFIPEEKVLFLGDCMYANLYSEKWNYTVEKTLQLLDKLEKYDAEIIFLSHTPEPLTKSQFSSQLSLLKNTAILTEKYAGNEPSIIQGLSEIIKRQLNEDELETIRFFVNGYSI
ncbi:MBL fold metallo-hydrolase [Heyndrickxia oleronia]|uniref:MBL fold metallo-hydrolase n=1 Tax=Heyndrickxia oleronia TaxID=38875 RepID=A0AAW6SP96_9BACI|nr:MBL fold metallo-hydrolase [Heyndrickxia oleronia]MDH5160040.1 MBL fold metallo-hydrolase [Heyndrickxia oleronia]